MTSSGRYDRGMAIQEGIRGDDAFRRGAAGRFSRGGACVRHARRNERNGDERKERRSVQMCCEGARAVHENYFNASHQVPRCSRQHDRHDFHLRRSTPAPTPNHARPSHSSVPKKTQLEDSRPAPRIASQQNYFSCRNILPGFLFTSPDRLVWISNRQKHLSFFLGRLRCLPFFAEKKKSPPPPPQTTAISSTNQHLQRHPHAVPPVFYVF